MRKLMMAAGVAALAMAGNAVNAGQNVNEKGEAKLKKLLEGHVAGEPLSCISTMNTNNLQVIDRTAVIYKSGRTIYVARPLNPAHLRSDRILTLGRTGNRLCTSDTINVVNPGGGLRGTLTLNKFVPYTPL